MMSFRFAAVAIAMAGVLATAAHAAIEGPHSGSQSAPTEQRGMMGMHGMMKTMGQMGPAQRKQMMDNCNKMMGAATPSQAPGAPQQPRS